MFKMCFKNLDFWHEYCLVILFDYKLQVFFLNSPKWTNETFSLIFKHCAMVLLCQPITLHGKMWIFPKLKTSNAILLFSPNLCPLKNNLPGNAVWPLASGFQKFAKLDNFWHFQWTFVHSKCKCISLRSKYWMRLFLWFQTPCRWYISRNLLHHSLSFPTLLLAWYLNSIYIKASLNPPSLSLLFRVIRFFK